MTLANPKVCWPNCVSFKPAGLQIVRATDSANVPRLAANNPKPRIVLTRIVLKSSPCGIRMRRGGRIVSVAYIVAMGVNTDGRSEVLGMEIGTRKPSRSGPSSYASWTPAKTGSVSPAIP